MIRVLIADDPPVLQLGLLSVLETFPTVEIVGKVGNFTELVDFLDTQPCDVVVTDLLMPGTDRASCLNWTRLLVDRFPELKVAVLTMLDDAKIFESLSHQGISCLLSKSDDLGHVVVAIHAAYAGGRYRSPIVERLLRAVA